MTRPSVRVVVATLVLVVAAPVAAQGPAIAAAAPTVKLTGSIYGTSAQPLRDVSVELWRDGADEGDQVAVRRTDDAGRYTFPAVPKSTKTKYYLIARDLSGAYVSRNSASFTAASPAAPNLTMERAGSIVGKVSKKIGGTLVPAEKVQVSALEANDGQARVAANGTFRIGGLPAGTYTLELFSSDFALACYDNASGGEDGCDGTRTVKVTAGATTTINPQVLDDPLERVSGTLTDTKGKPVGVGSVEVYDADDPTDLVGFTTVSTSGAWTTGGIDHVGPVKIVATDGSGRKTVWFRNAKTFAKATRLALTDGKAITDVALVLPTA